MLTPTGAMPSQERTLSQSLNGTADLCIHPPAEDWLLVEACKRDDSAAWSALIRRYEKSVYKFAYTLAHNHEDTADIVGQVFLRLYKNIHTFRNESSFLSWLFRIVRNVYVDTCIRAPHRGHLSLDDGLQVNGDLLIREIADPAPSPEEISIENEQQEILQKAIRHLPQYQRKIMELYHAEGRSYEEIACMTGLSLGTVKSRLSRARQMLRERLMSTMAA